MCGLTREIFILCILQPMNLHKTHYVLDLEHTLEILDRPERYIYDSHYDGQRLFVPNQYVHAKITLHETQLGTTILDAPEHEFEDEFILIEDDDTWDTLSNDTLESTVI